MRYYKVLQDMPYHSKNDLLILSGKVYIWEIGKPTEQYTLPAEIVENNTNWFEEAFPNWTQNEPCWFVSFNGLIVQDYFDRATHSSLARFGNLFKSKEDAELAQEKIKQVFEPFADVELTFS